MKEEQDRANAPDLTQIEYIKQLADHGDALKLELLHSATDNQITLVVQ